MMNNAAPELRLRLFFDETVATGALAPEATWSDIAAILSSQPVDGFGSAYAIDVRLPVERLSDIGQRRDLLLGPFGRVRSAHVGGGDAAERPTRRLFKSYAQ